MLVHLFFLRCIVVSDKQYGPTEGRYWTSGIQIKGSPEPDPRFIWSYSGQPVLTDLWLPNEPSNSPDQVYVKILFHHAWGPELVGLYYTSKNSDRFICEYKLMAPYCWHIQYNKRDETFAETFVYCL